MFKLLFIFRLKINSSQAATTEMKQTNYGMKKLNLKKRINKRPKLVQKSKKKFVIQKKSIQSETSCLNENETLRALKAKQILEKKKKYGNLFVKGCYFLNDENLKDDLYERKITYNDLVEKP